MYFPEYVFDQVLVHFRKGQNSATNIQLFLGFTGENSLLHVLHYKPYVTSYMHFWVFSTVNTVQDNTLHIQSNF